MKDSSLLSKYLAGDANADESLQCEQWLKESGSVEELIGELGLSSNDDSLVETLRSLGNETDTAPPASGESRELLEQIQSLVANRQTAPEDFDRILSPAENSDELGRIAHYRVIEFIAGGGMGLVFKAEDTKLNRLVCIKVLNPSLENNRDAVARFSREAKSAAKLRNTRITTVLEFGEHRELPYLVMELLEGQSLRDKLNVAGKLSPATARKITIQIAEGLRYAHQRGFLHRDIKPENIWVTPEGDVKLLDFGLARAIEESDNLTHSGTILGTPNYMSPEQVQGKDLDAKSDLFSVGTVLFEMLTGESPFGKSNLFSTMMSVANDTLTFPEDTKSTTIPDELRLIVESLLQKSPEDRIGSADQLISALKNVDGKMPSLQPKLNKSAMSPSLAGLLGAFAGACLLALAVLLFQLNDKGTLVVEADPSINVSIANEEVSIEDPQTGKNFKVTIGENPLPSGVYQLQLADESGYTLSSNIITIRRGEKQIVRVELKPAEPGVAAADVAKENKVKDGEVKANVVDAVATASVPNLSLSALPTLDASELNRKLGFVAGKRLFPAANVSNPSPKKGVTSWSVESCFGPSSTQLNADGSLIAFSARSSQQTAIRDRSGKLLHLIPAGDSIAEVSWSPDPSVIAVIVNGDMQKRVVVWKLSPDHVEVIDVIPCDCEKIGWSWDGLKLALKSADSNEITFVNLAKKGGVFTQPNLGIEGSISDRPWSNNGRYFAASLEDEVGVWDLEDQRVVHVFAKKSEAKFLPEDNMLAVEAKLGWEVWDLGTFERKRLLMLESNWKQTWCSPDFKKQLGLTKGNVIVVKDAISGETIKSDSSIRKLVLKLRRVHWAADSNGIVFSLFGDGTLISEASGDGALEGLADITRVGEFERRFVSFSYRSSSELPMADYSNNGRIAWLNRSYANPEEPEPVSIFDLKSNKSLPDSKIKMFETGASYRISPNGKYLAIVGSDSPSDSGGLSKQWSKDVSKVRVCSVETAEVVRTFETGRPQSLSWTPDSDRLVVSVLRYQTKEEAEKEAEARRNKLYREVIGRSDKNNDGKLDSKEMSNSNLMRVDKDKDGFVTVDEYKAYAAAFEARNNRGSSRARRGELETKIISLSDDEQIVLSPTLPGSKSDVKFCFQRGSSDWQIAAPAFYKDQIVLPLFDTSTYGNGSHTTTHRTIDGKREQVKPNDRLGFFDIKTGKLLEVVELKHAFEGTRLEVTDQMIMIGARSEFDRSNVDSFIVLDRNKGNLFYGTNPQYGLLYSNLNPDSRVRSRRTGDVLKPGIPYVSPTRPLVAFLSGQGIEIWKLDSEKDSFRPVHTFSRSDKDLQLEIAWHPNSPIVAWLDDYRLVYWNADQDELVKTEQGRWYKAIIPTEDGWLLVGSRRMEKRDLKMNILKTWVTTSPREEGKLTGAWDQCITAEGDVLVDDNVANLRVIQLRGNRFETRPVNILDNDEN
ncbi:serine/threonine protein kinase [Mariniblastus fucicola]|uniref:non-specific serine/threonine protein kinase n=1 Tax=Mariniblastus fucicola TaxID=980251 RepID=A0A5B9P6J4_9BACT|nr:serine/threonine-protein kinase [Mariniblastus fucicola]QEG21894.1 Serine/threonine-protein kinase PknB [Mariniblastus fucicola]